MLSAIIPILIVCPNQNDMITIRYGAELVFCTPTPTGRKETADKIAADTGGVIVHPYDNDDVIAGQVIVTTIK